MNYNNNSNNGHNTNNPNNNNNTTETIEEYLGSIQQIKQSVLNSVLYLPEWEDSSFQVEYSAICQYLSQQNLDCMFYLDLSGSQILRHCIETVYGGGYLYPITEHTKRLPRQYACLVYADHVDFRLNPLWSNIVQWKVPCHIVYSFDTKLSSALVIEQLETLCISEPQMITTHAHAMFHKTILETKIDVFSPSKPSLTYIESMQLYPQQQLQALSTLEKMIFQRTSIFKPWSLDSSTVLEKLEREYKSREYENSQEDDEMIVWVIRLHLCKDNISFIPNYMESSLSGFDSTFKVLGKTLPFGVCIQLKITSGSSCSSIVIEDVCAVSLPDKLVCSFDDSNTTPLCLQTAAQRRQWIATWFPKFPCVV